MPPPEPPSPAVAPPASPAPPGADGSVVALGPAGASPAASAEVHPSLPSADAPCAAWSQQAAELAAALEQEVARWPATLSHYDDVRTGALVPVGEGRLVPFYLAEHASDRALLVGGAVGARLRSDHVIALWSAHWVHTGAAFPDPIDLLTFSHRSVIPGVRVHHSGVAVTDIEQIAGTPVTTPARTGADLLRFDGEAAIEGVEALVRTGLCTGEQIGERLAAARGGSGSRVARRLLEQIVRRCASAPEGAEDADTRERAVLRVREVERWARRGYGGQASTIPRPSTTLPSAVTR
ncbi:hypothetical protein I8D64_00215 [Brachybacterium sp. MASK1Z-5]|uniref:Uncharacterized protein n=1 Tax=Brachybacterium halotolerans TaxID=2795215 RepID=A0ABS1B5B7_9MICO|nr:hypothetical protein [Brachybacterium halotolerans]MBK0329829.1 hypothetical protein [Brachybacterium halotolerans]